MTEEGFAGGARVAKAVVLYTALGFLPLGINVFLLPLYAAYLEPEQFGLLAEANITLTFAQLFVVVGLDAAFSRFFFDFTAESGGRHRLLGAIVTVLCLVTLAYAAILAVFGNWLFSTLWPDLPFWPFGPVVLASALIQPIHYLVFLYYRNDENLPAAAFVAISVTLMSVVGTLAGVVLMDGGALGAFGGKLLGPAAGILIGLAGPLGRSRPNIDVPLLKSLFAFSLPLVGYALLAYLLFNGDRILLARWFSVADLGLYTLAVVLISPMEIILQASQQAMQPMFFRMFAANAPSSGRSAGDLYVAIVNASVIALVALSCTAGSLLELLGRPGYLGAVQFIPLLGFAQLFRVLFCATQLSVQFSKRTEVLTAATALSIVGGLGTAFIFRGELGALAIPAGVVGWKATQCASGLLLARRAGCISIRLHAAWIPIIVTGGWALTVTLAPERTLLVSVALGAMPAIVAALGLLRAVRRSAFFRAWQGT